MASAAPKTAIDTVSVLPSPDQEWSHSTNSFEKLRWAVADDRITAIEADILLGRVIKPSPVGEDVTAPSEVANLAEAASSESSLGFKILEPIMAHPPHRESDLSARNFLDIVAAERLLAESSISSETEGDSVSAEPKFGRRLRKHIKLDFKEMEAVGPVLEILSSLAFHPSKRGLDTAENRNNDSATQDDSTRSEKEENTVFLNADIFPGPGMRQMKDSYLDAEQFVETCLGYIDFDCEKNHQPNKDKKLNGTFISFSLGFKVKYDCPEKEVYTNDDSQVMENLVDKHRLTDRSAGVILALNARVLSRNPGAFDSFLGRFPASQVLAWTGTGEPPIPRPLIVGIRRHFEASGFRQKLGFDVVLKD